MNRNAPKVQFAGFGWRLVAAVVDTIIVLVPFAVLRYVFGPTNTHPLASSGDEFVSADVGLFDEVLFALLIWLYKAVSESSWHGATWGKRLAGIKVTDVNGARLSFGRATLRALPWYAGGLGQCVDFMIATVTKSPLGIGGFSMMLNVAALLSFLFVAVSSRKQGVHDIMARCLVVWR